MVQVEGSEKIPLIVAHRGASRDAPENTLSAFKLAFERNADAIEGDFRLTRDGHIVCIHDRDGHRTLGKRLSVAGSTLAQLRKLDAGSWKGEQWTGERISTLGEVLDVLPRKCRLYMEVKCGQEILDPLSEVIRSRQSDAGQLVLISYDKEVIRHFKQRHPHLPAYLVVKFQREQILFGTLKPTVQALIAELREICADGLDCQADPRLKPEFAGRLRDAGFPLHVWTVNDTDTAMRFIKDFGVDSVTTDRPGWLRKQLES